MGALKKTFSIYVVVTVIFSEFPSGHSSKYYSTSTEDDFLSLLLQDREERVKNFHLITRDQAKIDLFHTVAHALSNIKGNVELPKSVAKAYPFFASGYRIFAAKSVEYSREGFQLIRDLILEMMPNWVYDYDCVERAVERDDFLKAVLYTGWCYNLTFVDKDGNHIKKSSYSTTYYSDYFIKSGHFLNLDNSKFSSVDKIGRLLNGILLLSLNAYRADEFIGGSTSWYGKISESNYRKWQNVTNHILICKHTTPLSLPEGDDSEKLALMVERQARLATFPYEYLNYTIVQKLSDVDTTADIVLNDAEKSLSMEIGIRSNYLLDNMQKQEFILELCQLYRDLMMEIELITSEKFPHSLKDNCTRYFIQEYQREYLKRLPRNPRDDVIGGNFTKNDIIARYILNLTYVDYHGNRIENINGKIKGKYIYSHKSVECPLSRRLRHIINGYERLYFKNIEKLDPYTSMQEKTKEFLIECKYHDISKFVEDNISQTVIANEQEYANDKRARWLGDNSQSLEDLIYITTKSQESTLPPDQLNKFPLLAEAHNILSHWPLSLRQKGYRYVQTLCIIQGSLKDKVKYLTNLFGTKTTRKDTCKISSQCPDKLLRLLQIIGKQFDLKYINELGDEVLIDDRLSGVFVYVSIFEDENHSTVIIRHQLNAFIKLIKEAIARKD